MAWTFADEIHSLTGYDADSTGTSTSGETYLVHTNRWLTDGAKEVINNLPSDLLRLCTSFSLNFTSTVAGSESETLNTGKIFAVFAGSHEARKIPSTLKYKASDSSSIEYATSTDPVYYIDGNKINVLPASIGTCKYEEVQYPSVDSSTTAISNFPDEAEHLVVLFAAIKAVEYMIIDTEDLELYIPMLQTLKQDYAQGLASLKGESPAQGGGR